MSLQADTAALRNLGKQVVANSEEYQAEINKIYATVDNLRENWKGEDNQAFVNKVYEYKEGLEALGKEIKNYGFFLDATAGKIERVQSDITSAASNI